MSINDKVIESVVYRRIAPILLVMSLVIAIVAAVGTYVNGRAVTESNTARLNDNEANAVTSCENANESRAASRTLWNYVVDLAVAGNTDATAQETAVFEEIREYINKVYMPRDCADLSRKYPLPPPPALP